jgi:hypothetical protein
MPAFFSSLNSDPCSSSSLLPAMAGAQVDRAHRDRLDSLNATIPAPAPPTGPPSVCSGSTKLVLHADQALGREQAAAFCRTTHGPSAGLPGSATQVLSAAQSLVQQSQVTGAAVCMCRMCNLLWHRAASKTSARVSRCMPAALYPSIRHARCSLKHTPCCSPQLTPTPGNPHGEWSAAVWLGPTLPPGSTRATWTLPLPWCPDEPNDKDAAEDCATMLTACTPGRATAAVNDYPCNLPLRVMCAFPSADCGECFARFPMPSARRLPATDQAQLPGISLHALQRWLPFFRRVAAPAPAVYLKLAFKLPPEVTSCTEVDTAAFGAKTQEQLQGLAAGAGVRINVAETTCIQRATSSAAPQGRRRLAQSANSISSVTVDQSLQVTAADGSPSVSQDAASSIMNGISSTYSDPSTKAALLSSGITADNFNATAAAAGMTTEVVQVAAPSTPGGDPQCGCGWHRVHCSCRCSCWA